MKRDKLNRSIIILLLVFISIHVFIVDIDYYDISNIKKNIIFTFLLEYSKSLKLIDLKLIILVPIMYVFYNKLSYYLNRKVLLLSLLLSFVSIVGKCYMSSYSSMGILFMSSVQLYKFFLLFVGYLIIYYSVIFWVLSVGICKLKCKCNSFLFNFCYKYYYLLIIVCWLPYIIFFYPGGGNWDTVDSICQFFHLDYSWSIDYINLITNKVYINKHHSVLFTIILGNFIKFGKILGSNSFGYYMFVLFQLIIYLSVIIYMFSYIKKFNFSKIFFSFLVLYFCFSPIVIKFSVTAVKDTLSASFTLLYVIFLHQIAINYNNFFKSKKKILLLIVTMLLVMMFRNNGIITILLSFPFLIFLKIKNKKRVFEILVLVLLIFITYSNILLPSFGVSNGSIREVLSAPFMQVARVVKFHKSSISKNDKNIIDSVLSFDDISNLYDPNLSDGVKGTYKKDCSFFDRYNFFVLWFNYFRKYPLDYFDSFFNSTYGYYYPISLDVGPSISLLSSIREEGSMVFENFGPFVSIRRYFNNLLELFYGNPFFVYFNNVGMIDLFLLFSIMMAIRKKKYEYLIPMLPLLSIFLVCLFSPVNGSARYILPIFLSVPMIVLVDYNVFNLDK